jgi:murein DD-endopeptidase MepM/ murein hydrolase activator NlpD
LKFINLLKRHIPGIVFLTVCFVYIFFIYKTQLNAEIIEDFTEEVVPVPELVIEEIIIEQPNIWNENPAPFVAVLTERIYAGDPVTVVFLPETHGGVAQTDDKVYTASLYSTADRRLAQAKFFDWACDPQGHIIQTAIFTVPSTQKTGPVELKVEGDNGFVYELNLTVESRDYESEVIVLNKELTELRTTSDPERTRQAYRLWAILNHTGETIYTQDAFTTPIRRDTRRTSFFGDKRVYSYSNGTTDTSIHAGIDYGTPTGTEIVAAARGRVVLAQMRIVTGNSIIIEHMPGVYSLYYHLDEIKITEGEIVEAGQLIGLSGATGLATGPHLHWEIRANAENTDPDYVSDLPLLDTEALYAQFYKEDTPQDEPQDVQSDSQDEDMADGYEESPEEPPDEPVDRWQNNSKTFFTMLHNDPRPGDPVTLVFYPETENGISKIEDDTFTASCTTRNGRKLATAKFFKWNCDEQNHIINAAVFSIPSTELPQNVIVKIEGNKGFVSEFPIKIKERIFELDLVVLNKSLTELRTAYDPVKTAQAENLYRILGITGNTIWTTETFTAPLPRNTRRTSPFGDNRTYQYADGTTADSIHAGIDYGVPTGTPVLAGAAGKVVLAMDRIATGNSVIIEHYPGVYSLYYHMDSLQVHEGDIVQSGDVVGLSGATGLATGPHLHWEIRVSSENTNPDTVCDIPLLDIEVLEAKLQKLQASITGE